LLRHGAFASPLHRQQINNVKSKSCQIVTGSWFTVAKMQASQDII
jgi:hypothetical protein